MYCTIFWHNNIFKSHSHISSLLVMLDLFLPYASSRALLQNWVISGMPFDLNHVHEDKHKPSAQMATATDPNADSPRRNLLKGCTQSKRPNKTCIFYCSLPWHFSTKCLHHESWVTTTHHTSIHTKKLGGGIIKLKYLCKKHGWQSYNKFNLQALRVSLKTTTRQKHTMYFSQTCCQFEASSDPAALADQIHMHICSCSPQFYLCVIEQWSGGQHKLEVDSNISFFY